MKQLHYSWLHWQHPTGSQNIAEIKMDVVEARIQNKIFFFFFSFSYGERLYNTSEIYIS